MNKLSVIIPVYNKKKFVKKCIDSVLKWGKASYEIIIIDDGSTDGSSDIIDKFKVDSRVKIIHKKNGGVSSARNYGLKVATGEYVTFVDADDEVIINSLTKIIYNLNSKSDIYIAGAIQDGQNVNLKIFEDLKFVNDGSKAVLAFVLSGGEKEKRIPKQATRFMSGCKEKFYRRDFLNSIQLKFDEELGRNEDVLWSCCAYYYAQSIRFLPINVYINKEDENGITKSMNIDLLLKNMNIFIDKFNCLFYDVIDRQLLAHFYFQQSLIVNYELYRAKKLNKIAYREFCNLLDCWYKKSTSKYMIKNLMSNELPLTKRLAYYFMKLRLYSLVGIEMYIHHQIR